MDTPTPAPGAGEPGRMFRRPDAQPAVLPEISDYWPRPPRPAGPLPPPAPVPPAPRPRRRRRSGAVLVTAVLLAGTVAVVVTRLRDSGRDPAPPLPKAAAAAGTTRAAGTTPDATEPVPVLSESPPSTPARTPTPAAGPARAADATFELVSDATTVTLSTAAIGTDLYRISTPRGSGVKPKVTGEGGTIRLALVRSGGDGAAAVTIVLSSRRRWTLTMTGGSRTSILDLGGAAVRRVELAGGAHTVDLTLPEPDGTVPVLVTGGAGTLRIHTAGRVPARVRLGHGAGSVAVDGRTEDGVRRGRTVASPDFGRRRDRIDVDAVAGVGHLSVGPR